MDPSEWNHHLEGITDADDGAPLVRAEKDAGFSNCYNFTIFKEDHTLGNLLTQELLNEERVVFAGYRIQHPMTDLIIVRVNVSEPVDHPIDLVASPIRNIINNLGLLKTEFDRQVKNYKKKSPANYLT